MNGHALKKLNELLNRKYWSIFEDELNNECPLSAFRSLCKSVGISVVYNNAIDSPDGQVFEELVVVNDPAMAAATGFRRLEMSRETAEKILTLGMP